MPKAALGGQPFGGALIKGTAAILRSHIGVGSLRILVPVLLVLAATGAFLFAASPAAAEPIDEIDDLNLPIKVEESRDAPKRVLRQVQGQGVGVTQTSTTLVSNTGETAGPADAQFTFDFAQAFTAGSNSSGYTLTSIQLRLKSTGTQAIFSVAIHADSSGEPAAASLGTLKPTTALTSNYSLVQYNASGNGINLDAGKTYWVVMDTSFIRTTTHFQTTTSGDEDSDGTGWSIADDRLARGSVAIDWSTIVTRSSATYLRVNGYAKATTIDPLSQDPRDPITVTYTNANGIEETVEIRAASAYRDTLYSFFYDSCSLQRSATTLRDYSWRNADGHLMQAKNGWKYVEVQNARGEVTGTRRQTLDECASHGMYVRQQQCSNSDWRDRNPHLLDSWCPTYRTW